jgi:hypothetical protein
VCNELVACNLVQDSWRLAMYCAFRSEHSATMLAVEQLQASRVRYIKWLVRQIIPMMTFQERHARARCYQERYKSVVMLYSERSDFYAKDICCLLEFVCSVIS